MIFFLYFTVTSFDYWDRFRNEKPPGAEARPCRSIVSLTQETRANCFHRSDRQSSPINIYVWASSILDSMLNKTWLVIDPPSEGVCVVDGADMCWFLPRSLCMLMTWNFNCFPQSSTGLYRRPDDLFKDWTETNDVWLLRTRLTPSPDCRWLMVADVWSRMNLPYVPFIPLQSHSPYVAVNEGARLEATGFTLNSSEDRGTVSFQTRCFFFPRKRMNEETSQEAARTERENELLQLETQKLQARKANRLSWIYSSSRLIDKRVHMPLSSVPFWTFGSLFI